MSSCTKPAPPVDVSVWFLSSNLASLHSLAIHPDADHVKGKSPVQFCFPLITHTCNNSTTDLLPSNPPVVGRVKLNTDGSILDGVGGSGMMDLSWMELEDLVCCSVITPVLLYSAHLGIFSHDMMCCSLRS